MSLWRRFAAWRQGRQLDADLREELETHRSLTQDELERAGQPRDHAAAESRRRMGNMTLAREDARDVWMVRWADQLGRYIRHGIRGLIREPAFALTAILTLGLGTAATTTVFSAVDAELWRPLPYPDPHRLVVVSLMDAGSQTGSDPITIDDLNAWRAAAPAFSALAAEGRWGRRTARIDHAESLRAQEVTANYFTTLGRPTLVGRVFADGDARGSDAVVLGARAWARIFNNDPGVLGRGFMLDAEAKVVIGVVATDDSMGPDADLFVPIDESAAAQQRNPSVIFGPIGRLASGATAAIGREQLQVVIDRNSQVDANRHDKTIATEDLSAFYSTTDRRPLYFFLGASLLVLALTVANVAGLLLSRTFRRAPEFALRSALGGGTRALVTQLIVEGALIAVPGCALGLLLANQAMAVVSQMIPEDFLLRGAHIPVDLRVAAFSFVVALAATAGFVLIPVSIARRTDPSLSPGALGSGGRTSALPSAGRARGALLATQLALTVILLAGAGIFLKSFVALTHVPLGFDPAAAWSMRVAPSGPQYATDDQVRAYAATLTDRARAIPGVRDAAIATTSPLLSGPLVIVTKTGTAKPAAPDSGTRAIHRAVSPDYFATIGTRIVRGRGILPTDVAGAPAVAVVNEQFARAAFGGRDPIGAYVDLTGRHASTVRDGTVLIVGVASDIKEVQLNETKMSDVYVPFAQQPTRSFEVIVRGGDASMAKNLRSAAISADPSVPVTSVSTLDARVGQALSRERFNLILVAGFAIVAVLVGAIGIYGAMAYAATARWREFGVRLALGASPHALLGTALWQAARLGLIGGALGVAGAIGLGFWIGNALYLVPGEHNGLLYNVTTTDPLALMGALGGVVLVALLAGALPARRVARIDPVRALRAD